jgi:hypothetical protein
MRYGLLIFILLTLLLFSLAIATSEGTVTISVNSSNVWWNDPLNASGTARYSNQTGISSGTVTASLAGSTYGCPATTLGGNWYCTFNAPQELGSYTLTVTISNGTATFTNTTTINVKPSYGATPSGTGSRVVYETPVLMQQLDGAIKKVWIRIKIWK